MFIGCMNVLIMRIVPEDWQYHQAYSTHCSPDGISVRSRVQRRLQRCGWVQELIGKVEKNASTMGTSGLQNFTAFKERMSISASSKCYISLICLKNEIKKKTFVEPFIPSKFLILSSSWHHIQLAYLHLTSRMPWKFMGLIALPR